MKHRSYSSRRRARHGTAHQHHAFELPLLAIIFFFIGVAIGHGLS